MRQQTSWRKERESAVAQGSVSVNEEEKAHARPIKIVKAGELS